MYAMKISSSLKNKTLPSHAIPITMVNEIEHFNQYLKWN